MISPEDLSTGLSNGKQLVWPQLPEIKTRNVKISTFFLSTFLPLSVCILPLWYIFQETQMTASTHQSRPILCHWMVGQHLNVQPTSQTVSLKRDYRWAAAWGAPPWSLGMFNRALGGKPVPEPEKASATFPSSSFPSSASRSCSVCGSLLLSSTSISSLFAQLFTWVKTSVRWLGNVSVKITKKERVHAHPGVDSPLSNRPRGWETY